MHPKGEQLGCQLTMQLTVSFFEGDLKSKLPGQPQRLNFCGTIKNKYLVFIPGAPRLRGIPSNKSVDDMLRMMPDVGL